MLASRFAPTRRVGAPAYLGWTVFVLLAVPLAWLSIRDAAIERDVQDAPARAAAFLPSAGVADARIAMQRVVAANGSVDPEARALLRSAAAREPLSGQPFLLAGLDASAGGDDGRATVLFQEAQRRNPRAIVARYWLLDDYLRRGDYRAAIDEAQPIMTLQPRAAGAIVAMLTALIQVDAARPALVAELRDGPRWRRAFFRQTATSPLLARRALDLLKAAPNPDPSAALEERSLLSRGIVR